LSVLFHRRSANGFDVEASTANEPGTPVVGLVRRQHARYGVVNVRSPTNNNVSLPSPPASDVSPARLSDRAPRVTVVASLGLSDPLDSSRPAARRRPPRPVVRERSPRTFLAAAW
jgi:hypothetical protein